MKCSNCQADLGFARLSLVVKVNQLGVVCPVCDLFIRIKVNLEDPWRIKAETD